MTNACVPESLVQNRRVPPNMNSIDDLTKKIRCLRVARDDHDDRQINIADPVKHEEHKKEKEEEKEVEEEEEEDEEEEEEVEEEEEEDDDLIERGPMKSQNFPPVRNQPYNTDQCLALNINDNALLDESIEDLLWECKLQSITKNWNYVDGKSNVVPQVCVSKGKFVAPNAANVNDSAENLLPQTVVHDNFQASERVSENSNVYGLQEYRESSNLPYEATSQLNIDQSPVDFLAGNDSFLNVTFDPSVNVVAPANSYAYRPSQVSSFSPSSSSSSSNHSTDLCTSPYNCQVSCNQQLEDSFDFSIQNSTMTDTELLNMMTEFANLSEPKTDAYSGITFPDNLTKLDLESSIYLSCSDLVPLTGSPCDGQSSTSNAAFIDNFETALTADSNIPKMLDVESCSGSEAPLPVNRQSDRSAMPWALLNLPAGSSSAKLKEQVSSKEVKEAMKELLKLPDKELAQQDKDGDTMLMCLVGNADEFVRKKAYLAPLVERLSTMKGALTVENNRGEDALYLAALNCSEFPYVAGYLAAKMLQKNIDVSQRLYHTSGNTLMHSIAARGDSHTAVLAELLALRTSQGNAVFDLSKRNYDGKTAVHVAIESRPPSLANLKLLLKHGADPRIRETRCDDTALHTACRSCDSALVKVLLDACGTELVNAMNRNHDTPLHLTAAASNEVPSSRQTEVYRLLIHSGGNANLLNRQGKTPFALLPPDRQTRIGKVLYGGP